MKIIFGTLILISAILSAQEKKVETPKKSDTLKSKKLRKELISKYPGILMSDSIKQSNNINKMPVGKPKDTSSYLSLKEADKDYSKYKILNSITPKPSKTEVKK